MSIAKALEAHAAADPIKLWAVTLDVLEKRFRADPQLGVEMIKAMRSAPPREWKFAEALGKALENQKAAEDAARRIR